MTQATALAAGRRAASRRFVDTFAISVPDPSWTFDKTSKKNVQVTTSLFTTKGYVPPASGILSQDAQVGGRTASSSRREVRIPWDSAEVPHGAIAECIAIGPDTPPRMLGKKYRLGGSDGASQGTACHLEIIEELA